MKKVFCLLLILGITLSISACVPGVSENVTWEINDGILTISGEGYIGGFCTDMYETELETECYDETKIPWYGLEYHTVILGEGISRIDAHTFTDAKRLKKVIIQGKNVEVDHCAFYNCENLQEVENSEQIETMATGAFENCVSLKSIKLGSNYNLSGAIWDYKWSCFWGCSALESVEIHKDNKKLKSVDGVVYSIDKGELLFYPMAKQGKSFVVPENVTGIQAMAFANNDYLENIDFAGECITSIDYAAFDSCDSLKSITIPSSVTVIDSRAFEGAENITICCSQNSAAEEYAKANNIAYTLDE